MSLTFLCALMLSLSFCWTPPPYAYLLPAMLTLNKAYPIGLNYLPCELGTVSLATPHSTSSAVIDSSFVVTPGKGRLAELIDDPLSESWVMVIFEAEPRDCRLSEAVTVGMN